MSYEAADTYEGASEFASVRAHAYGRLKRIARRAARHDPRLHQKYPLASRREIEAGFDVAAQHPDVDAECCKALNEVCQQPEVCGQTFAAACSACASAVGGIIEGIKNLLNKIFAYIADHPQVITGIIMILLTLLVL